MILLINEFLETVEFQKGLINNSRRIAMMIDKNTLQKKTKDQLIGIVMEVLKNGYNQNNPGIITDAFSAFDELIHHSLKEGLEVNSQEYFFLVGLSRDNKVMKTITLFKGGSSMTLVDRGILFRKVLLEGFENFIVAHNHPSENLTPSQQDLATTKAINEGGELIGVKCTDHLIFNYTGYYSIRHNHNHYWR